MCRGREADYGKPTGEGMGECMAVSRASGKLGVWFRFGHLSNAGQLWTTTLSIHGGARAGAGTEVVAVQWVGRCP